MNQFFGGFYMFLPKLLVNQLIGKRVTVYILNEELSLDVTHVISDDTNDHTLVEIEKQTENKKQVSLISLKSVDRLIINTHKAEDSLVNAIINYNHNTTGGTSTNLANKNT